MLRDKLGLKALMNVSVSDSGSSHEVNNSHLKI